MLDFEVDGLDGISELTRNLGGTAIVVLGILVAVGFAYFTIGRANGLSRSQEKGMKMVGVGLASIVLLSSIGAAVSWGISQGGGSLMPSEARQQDIVVEREAPVTTCVEQAVRNFNQEPTPLSHQERVDMVETVSKGDLQVAEDNGGFYVHERAEESEAGYAQDSRIEEVTVLKWYTDGNGGDCGGGNTNSAACTDMDIETVLANGEEYDVTHEVVGPDGSCSD